MTPAMLNLQWEKMSLYPAGYFTRGIPVQANVTYPGRLDRGDLARRREPAAASRISLPDRAL